MGTENTENAQQNVAGTDCHEKEGFFARRWRLLKAGVKSAVGYLLKPKTYLYALGFAGVGLLLGQQFGIGGLTLDSGVAGVAAYATKMIALGTVMHMTIDIFKEGKLDGFHPEVPQPCQMQQQQMAQAQGHAQEQNKQPRGPYDYGLDEVQSPSVPMMAQGQQQGPTQPTMDR